MKVKAIKTITTCITKDKEYDVIENHGETYIIEGDDGLQIGFSSQYFEIKNEIKQTPVEWLVQQLTAIGDINPDLINLHKHLVKTALEMEKEFKEDAFEEGKEYGETCAYQG